MALGTVDPNYWSHPPPAWAVLPELHVFHGVNAATNRNPSCEKKTLKYAVCGCVFHLGNVPCVGLVVEWIRRTHTRHISEFFGNGNNRRCLFTPDLRLFTPNTAQDEVISTNYQTQHWKTTNIWLVVTSLQALFLRRIAESSQPIIRGRYDWMMHDHRISVCVVGL